ncbi:MAG: hypothetical protein ACK5KU_02230 [Beutenbergiaceae bacterium]
MSYPPHQQYPSQSGDGYPAQPATGYPEHAGGQLQPYPAQPTASYPTGAHQPYPAQPYPGQGYPPNPPRPPRGKGLGVVAFVAGLICLVGASGTGIVIVLTLNPAVFDQSEVIALTSLSIGLTAIVLLMMWAGFALWPIIQGIVAVVQKRGTNFGLAAVAMGVAGPAIGIGIPATFWMSITPAG